MSVAALLLGPVDLCKGIKFFNYLFQVRYCSAKGGRKTFNCLNMVYSGLPVEKLQVRVLINSVLFPKTSHFSGCQLGLRSASFKLAPRMEQLAAKQRPTFFEEGLVLKFSCYYTGTLQHLCSVKVAVDQLHVSAICRNAIAPQKLQDVLEIRKFASHKPLDLEGVRTHLLAKQLFMAALRALVGCLHGINRPPRGEHRQQTSNKRLKIQNEVAPGIAACLTADFSWLPEKRGGKNDRHYYDHNEDLAPVFAPAVQAIVSSCLSSHRITVLSIRQGRAA